MGNFTGVNNVIVLEEALSAMSKALVPLRAFSLSVSPDPARKGDTVRVPLTSAMTAQINTTSYESGDMTITGAEVSINTTISCSWPVKAFDDSKSDVDEFNAGFVGAVRAVATGIQMLALNTVTLNTFGGPGVEQVVTAANFGGDALADGRNYCVSTLNMRSADGISVLLCPDYYAALLKDDTVNSLAVAGIDPKLGLIGRYHGLTIYEAPAINDCAAYNTSALRGFYCQPRAIAVAVRPPFSVPAAVYDVNKIIVEPETGIPLNVREWIDPGTNARWGCVEAYVGVRACDTNALYRIVATDNS